MAHGFRSALKIMTGPSESSGVVAVAGVLTIDDPHIGTGTRFIFFFFPLRPVSNTEDRSQDAL